MFQTFLFQPAHGVKTNKSSVHCRNFTYTTKVKRNKVKNQANQEQRTHYQFLKMNSYLSIQLHLQSKKAGLDCS